MTLRAGRETVTTVARYPILNATRKLSELFPPDHPDTPWLLRLAILRDDLSHELHQLPLKQDDPPSAVWRCAYTLRKIGITIDETTSIFRNEIGPRLSDVQLEHGEEFSDKMTRAIESLRAARELLQPLRNSLGAHVDPKNASKRNVDPTRDVIRTHGDSEFYVRLDLHNGQITNFHELTAAAFLFCRPDVKTFEDLDRKHAELSARLAECLHPTFATIDLFLFFHWRKLGVMRW